MLLISVMCLRELSRFVYSESAPSTRIMKFSFSIKIAQKPYTIGSSGPKALKYESFEGRGFRAPTTELGSHTAFATRRRLRRHTRRVGRPLTLGGAWGYRTSQVLINIYKPSAPPRSSQTLQSLRKASKTRSSSHMQLDNQVFVGAPSVMHLQPTCSGMGVWRRVRCV